MRLPSVLIGTPIAQQAKEVQPALARSVPNQNLPPLCGRDMVVADLRADFIFPAWRAPVSSTVIHAVDCKPARSTSRLSVEPRRPINPLAQQRLRRWRVQ